MRLQKWCLPGLLLLDKVPAGSCLSSSHFKITKWVFCAYGLGAFHSVTFVLDLRMGGSAHEPFKSGISVPYSSVFLLVLIPIDFQNQMFGDLVLPEPVLWVRMPAVRLNPFTC